MPKPDYRKFGYDIYEKESETTKDIVASTPKGEVKLYDFYLAGSSGELKRQKDGEIKKFLEHFENPTNNNYEEALTYRGYHGNFMKTGAHDITCGYTGTKSGYPLWMPVEAEYIAGMPSFDQNYCGACMKFELHDKQSGETRKISLLYGDNLYQYQYDNHKKHMDIANAAFAYLKHGDNLPNKSVDWTNLHELKFYDKKSLKVTFSRCDWGDKKMMYASKFGEIINIRRAPYAIGKIQTKNVSEESQCDNEEGYYDARRKNAESWTIDAFRRNDRGQYTCLKMWPYKYEDKDSCKFVDVIDIANGPNQAWMGVEIHLHGHAVMTNNDKA